MGIILDTLIIPTPTGVIYEVAIVNDVHKKMQIDDIDTYKTTYKKAIYDINTMMIGFEGSDYSRNLTVNTILTAYNNRPSKSTNMNSVIEESIWKKIKKWFGKLF